MRCVFAGLRLGSNQLGTEGVQALVEMLDENETLETLEILDNGLSPAQGMSLATATVPMFIWSFVCSLWYALRTMMPVT